MLGLTRSLKLDNNPLDTELAAAYQQRAKGVIAYLKVLTTFSSLRGREEGTEPTKRDGCGNSVYGRKCVPYSQMIVGHCR